MDGQLDQLIIWLQSLPPVALYMALGAAAAIENVFPPLPTDSIVALGAFLAARGVAEAGVVFASIFVGNMMGATAAYWAGRRLGADRVRSWIFGPPKQEEAAEDRLRAAYIRYGLVALFASRLVPGVRAIVAPLAGALHVPFAAALTVMAVASGLWYGLIMVVAYRVSANLETLVAKVSLYGRDAGIVVAALALAGGLAWWYRRRAALRNTPVVVSETPVVLSEAKDLLSRNDDTPPTVP